MRTFLSILTIIAITIIGSYLMISNKPEIKKKEKKVYKSLNFSSQIISFKTQPITLYGHGLFRFTQAVQIIPQVSGKIVWISEKLYQGQFFQKGELLFKIETDDYLFAIKQQEANLAQAKLEYQLELAQKQIAQHEWEFINKQLTSNEKEKSSQFQNLILRKEQLAQKKSQLASAKAKLNKAKLNLKRTHLIAPFDGTITTENITIGQVVTSNSRNLVSLVNNKKLEVVALLPAKNLSFFPTQPSKITAHIKGIKTKDIKILPSLDNKSKMAQILVKIKTDKLNQNKFLANDFTSVSFTDFSIKAYKIKNKFIRNNDTIWVSKNNSLDILNISILLRQNKYTYFTVENIQNPLEVITSFIATPYKGMKLKKIK